MASARPERGRRRVRARARDDRTRLRSGRDPSRRLTARRPPIACGGAAARRRGRVNLLMSMVVLPRIDAAFLAEDAWGATVAVGGRRRMVGGGRAGGRDRDAGRCSTAHGCRHCARAWMPAPTRQCCRPSAWRAWSASAPSSRRCPPSPWCATGCCRSGAARWSRLPSPTNVLAALTGSASGGMTIALDALGETYLRLAGEQGIDPALLHRVAVIGAGTLDSLPHNGAVVTLLAVCGRRIAKATSTSSWSPSSEPSWRWSSSFSLGSTFGSF